jgi:pimeloyl-ACP methyl ester carboxylesterase
MELWFGVLPALIVLAAIAVVSFVVHRLGWLHKYRYPGWRRTAEWLVLAPIALFIAAAALSIAVNAAAVQIFRAKNPLPGQILRVNGQRMHIFCEGSGSPTIVLESGLGDDSTIWGAVQPSLAKTTRVCSYDRPGLGRSELISTPQDANHVADELHALLKAANVQTPIVLMGHSVGGLYIREYAARFTGDVTALIFVDGATPLQDENAALYANDPHGWRLWRDRLENRIPLLLGVPRFKGECTRSFPGFSPHAAALYAEEECTVDWRASDAEENLFHLSGQETLNTGPFGDVPILIFSQDTTKPPDDALDGAVEIAWNQMQENLKNLSTRSRRIIAKNSHHLIQVDRPDLLEREVPLFIEQVRGAAPPPRYGTTVME